MRKNPLIYVSYMSISKAYVCETCQIVSNCVVCPLCDSEQHTMILTHYVPPVVGGEGTASTSTASSACIDDKITTAMLDWSTEVGHA